MEAVSAGASGKRWMVRTALVGPILLLLIVATVMLGGRSGDDVSTVRVNDITDSLPTVPTTVPYLPDPVDTSTLQPGWYLILTPRVFTTEDELLLQAARELTIEARGVGYQEAKLIRAPASRGTCEGGVCDIGSPGMGYFVLLKGPYGVPSWGSTDADLDAKFEWHQTTQSMEIAEAASRGLTLEPGIALLEF